MVLHFNPKSDFQSVVICECYWYQGFLRQAQHLWRASTQLPREYYTCEEVQQFFPSAKPKLVSIRCCGSSTVQCLLITKCWEPSQKDNWYFISFFLIYKIFYTLIGIITDVVKVHPYSLPQALAARGSSLNSSSSLHMHECTRKMVIKCVLPQGFGMVINLV